MTSSAPIHQVTRPETSSPSGSAGTHEYGEFSGPSSKKLQSVGKIGHTVNSWGEDFMQTQEPGAGSGAGVVT